MSETGLGWRAWARSSHYEAKHVMLQTPDTTYFAIGIERMAVLMGEAGFTRVRRIDCLFQPVLVGSR